MSGSAGVNEDALLAEIGEAWRELWAFIDGLSTDAMTGPTDNVGWTVKDHLGHLAAWERSIGFLLTGRDRHDGLGVERDVYLDGDYDAINAEIRERMLSLTIEQVLDELSGVHEQTLLILGEKSDADLRMAYSDYAPDKPGRETGEPVVNYVLGNTAHHYQEHLEWMRALLQR